MALPLSAAAWCCCSPLVRGASPASLLHSSLANPNPIVVLRMQSTVRWTGIRDSSGRSVFPLESAAKRAALLPVGLGRGAARTCVRGKRIAHAHSAHSARSRAECFARGFEWQTAVAHLEACQLWLRLRFALLRRPHSPARSRAERPAGWRAVSSLQIKLERRGVCNAMRCLSNRIASHSRGRRRKQNDADLSRNHLNPSGNDGTLKRATHTQTTQQSQNAPGIGALRRAIYVP